MDTTFTVHQGHVLDVIKTIESESVHCVVTSPPYWGLRDYGIDDQLGLEDTPDEYVRALVVIFDAVWRVLRNDGTVWLNLGDTYSAHKDCKSVSQTLAVGGSREQAHVIAKGKSVSRNSRVMKSVGLKNKDLIGIPWRVAFALQSDGWYLRSDIIWSKPNPMPESVTDRPTKAHEYIFLLTKSERYYYDAESIREPFVDARMGDPGDYTSVYRVGSGRMDSNPTCKPTNGQLGRNRRSVWTVTTQPFSGAHFATFPPALITPCILAGAPVGGTVLDPFAGSGTSGVVAIQESRNFIGIELNPAYAEMARKRIAATEAVVQPSFFDAPIERESQEGMFQ